MNVQSWTILFSSWIPISGSEVISWPLWRQCKVVILSTKAAVHWNGSRSPLKTTWRWDGSRERVCSSRGPSKQQRKNKTKTWPLHVTVIYHRYSLITHCVLWHNYKSAVQQGIESMQQSLINVIRRISCHHCSLMLSDLTNLPQSSDRSHFSLFPTESTKASACNILSHPLVKPEKSSSSTSQ